jgi:nodulation protein E
VNGLRRVVITGMGAISAAGTGAGALWTAARDGVSGIRPLDIPRGEVLRVRIAGSVEGFDPAQHLGVGVPRTADRFTHFALIAVAEALTQSGLEQSRVTHPKTACIIGTGVGGIGTLDDGCFAFYNGRKFEPLAVPRVMPSSAASHVSIRHAIPGPSFGVTSACASASQSIGIAAQMIAHGIIDRAVAGGAEACITPATMRAWEMLRVLTPRVNCPFSKDRSGMVIGEGAAAFVLETEDEARARGAEILAELAGYGTTSDARDMIQPDVDGAAEAMRQALGAAGLPASAVGYINAHGTGTALNDRNEAAALHAVFGGQIDDVPVSSSKPIFGHALGASGALELVVTIEALRQQIIPPQINYSEPDPDCALNLPTGGAMPARFDVAMSNSFAFGGINAALVVARAP